MLVLDSTNTYGFSSASIAVYDNTYETDDSALVDTSSPAEFNLLIPTVQAAGMTNQMELYQPGSYDTYVANHGTPDFGKYGIGPTLIADILRSGASNVGVYTVNLRGTDATMANVICYAEYWVEKDVPYEIEGEAQYDYGDGVSYGPQRADGENDKAVSRDVLHIKFKTTTAPGIKTWTDLMSYMDVNVQNTNASGESADDPIVLPWFAVLYRGAGSYGNNIYFSLKQSPADYDMNMYYRLQLFNGQKMRVTDPILSFDRDSGTKYNTTYYIEPVFNDTFVQMRFLTANTANDIVELLNSYNYTLSDYLKADVDEDSGMKDVKDHSKEFSQLDPFTGITSDGVACFAIEIDEGSLDPTLTKAFHLSSGEDGAMDRDELFHQFYTGEIITDILSVLRYRFNYIPDLGYNDVVKQDILNVVNKRLRMTTATFMLGGNNGDYTKYPTAENPVIVPASFASAITEHQTVWFETNPNIRQIAAVQSAMKYDEYTKRTVVFPASYFDTMGLINHIRDYGLYTPYAGYEARWDGYIEDTMTFPAETTEYINTLYNTRINVVMKDFNPGAYMSDQLMNCQKESDQIQLNNAFLISNMLYDLVEVIHKNHYHFNEDSQVRMFYNTVDEMINRKYVPLSVYLSVSVFRVGTVGRAGSTNKIVVNIDMRDIAKWTEVELYLIDT